MEKVDTNCKLVKTHYNTLKETGLKCRSQSSILYLRNINNWVKSNLIQNCIVDISKNIKDIRVLDLGSGKGGDQMKWAKANVSHVSFTDIAETSIEQSKERYKSGRYKYTADFFVADFTQVDFFANDFTQPDFDTKIERNYHIVSCQFAIHYSFESYKQAQMTFKNISNFLLKDGFFIGTTVNSFELIKRLKNSTDNSFGNDIYKVTFKPDLTLDNLSLFGLKYDFFLEESVNCPEFVIYPPLMDKIAEDHNLKLIKRISFSKYYEENSSTDLGKCLLQRIRALGEYRVSEIAGLSEKDYPNVKMYDDPSKYQKVLTISQKEWEVFQLYDVFIYQKV